MRMPIVMKRNVSPAITYLLHISLALSNLLGAFLFPCEMQPTHIPEGKE